jgi:hypothetical protein
MSVRYQWLFWAPRSGTSFNASTQCQVAWWEQSNAATEITINYGTTSGSLSQTAQSTSIVHGSDRIHHVSLTGLTPNTTYYYQIPGASERKFKTAPAASAHADMKWAFGADSQEDTSFREQVAPHIFGLDPLFFVHVGDHVVTPDTDADWLLYFDDFWIDAGGSKFQTSDGHWVPIIPNLGNHDYPSSGHFDHFYTSVHNYYTIAGDCAFIQINQNQPDSLATSAAFLETALRTLRSNPDIRWIYVTEHYPSLNSRETPWTTQTGINVRQNFVQHLDRFGVTALFTSHDHHIKNSKPVYDLKNASSSIDKSTSDRFGWREIGDGGWSAAFGTMQGTSGWWLDSTPLAFASCLQHHLRFVQQSGATATIKTFVPSGEVGTALTLKPKTMGFLWFDSSATNLPERFVEVPYAAAMDIAGSSVSMWAMHRWKGVSTGGGDKQMLFGRRDLNFANYTLRIDELSSPAKYQLYISDAGGVVSAYGPAPTADTDEFVAVSVTLGTTIGATTVEWWTGPIGGTLTKYTSVSGDFTHTRSGSSTLPTSTTSLRIGATAYDAMTVTGSGFAHWYNGLLGPIGIWKSHKDYGATGATCPDWDDLILWKDDANTLMQFHWTEMALNGTDVTETDETGDWVATHKTGHTTGGTVTDTTYANVMRGYMYLEGEAMGDVPPPPPQKAYPLSQTGNTGNWVTTGAATPQEALADGSDGVEDDNTYIRSPADPSNAECEIRLEPMDDPGVHTGHKIKYRYRSQGDAPTSVVDLTVTLHQGTNNTPIATATHNAIGTSWVENTITLTSTEAGNITDYTDLRLRFKANTQVLDSYFDTVMATQAANMSAYYRLNESAGATSAADSSGNNLTSSAQTGVTYGGSGAASGTGTSVTIGSGGSIQLETSGAPRFTGHTQFTVNCWFRRTATGTSVTTGGGGHTLIEPIFTRGAAEAETDAADINWYIGYIASSNRLGGDFESAVGSGTPSVNKPITGVTNLSNDTWYMATLTYDGSNLRLYLNGQLEATVATTDGPASLNTSPATIGRASTSTGTFGANAGQFLGNVDEVTIWDNDLTAVEIAAIYAARNVS